MNQILVIQSLTLNFIMIKSIIRLNSILISLLYTAKGSGVNIAPSKPILSLMFTNNVDIKFDIIVNRIEALFSYQNYD